MQDLPTVESFLLDLSSAHGVQHNELVGAVLGPDITTHESVLVYDGDAFIGILSPYQTIYKNKYPQNTIASEAILHPPIITFDTPLSEAISHMLSLRIYTLPVFRDQETVIGVLQAKAITKTLIADSEYRQYIADNLEIRSPITTPKGSLVKDVYEILRKKNIARVIVVDAEGKAIGIVTRSDITDAFVKPTPKQRFAFRGGGDRGFGGVPAGKPMGFDAEKIKRIDAPIDIYMSKRVFNLPDTTSKKEAIMTMMNKNYSSIVFLDINQRPTGFLSTRDILTSIVTLSDAPQVDISMHVSGQMSNILYQELYDKLTVFGRKLQKRVKYSYIDVHVEMIKKSKSLPLQYTISLHIADMPGKDVRSSASHERAVTALTEAIDKIERQLR